MTAPITIIILSFIICVLGALSGPERADEM